MNNLSVALAADSAVTVGPKIYTTANKLFALVRFQPVGILVFQLADLMGVPLEVLIKIYRSRAGDRTPFLHLHEYARSFIEFLETENGFLWDASVQKKLVADRLPGYLDKVAVSVRGWAEHELGEAPLQLSDISIGVEQIIVRLHTETQQLPDQFGDADHFNEKFIDQFAEEIDASISAVFQRLPLTELARTKLALLCAYCFSKQSPMSDLYSGIAIAGYGEADLFPSVVAYHVEWVLSGRAKFIKVAEESISPRNQSVILALAQSDAILNFLSGIDPDYEETLVSYVSNLIKDSQGVQDETTIVEEFRRTMTTFGKEKHLEPAKQTAAGLPKDELATMAESLVQLMSFKRRISPERETVGGAVDVAVISKGDGFIWIKRKHYFSPELNPRYMSTYSEHR